jgi:hypothetical protein
MIDFMYSGNYTVSLTQPDITIEGHPDESAASEASSSSDEFAKSEAQELE